MTRTDTTTQELRRCKKLSFRNGDAIRKSELAGCYYCCRVFPASTVTKWVCENGGGRTAKCPHCETDSVMADRSRFPLTAEFLKSMEQYWFGDD
jgi:hypothetical protein